MNKMNNLFALSFVFVLSAVQAYSQGFETTATTWTMPAGGYKNSSSHNFGFYETAETGAYYSGCQGWSTLDINGDGAVDLVVTSQGNGTYKDGFGVGSSPCWKVYLNTGSGFSTTATNWTLPSGGYKNSSGHNFGFNATAEDGYYYSGCQGWSTMDMDGDGKPDLVVTSQGDGTYKKGFGVGSSPYWKVYLNTGSGFSTTATNWTLPSGGYKNSAGYNFGFYATFESGYYYNGCQGWSTMDIDGDGKQDLVITSQGDGTYKKGFGVGSSPYWKVYLNTGSGFSTTATNWTLPSGGYKNSAGYNFGFYATFEDGYYYSGCQGWSTMDIDGDGKQDLVITSQGNGTYKDGFGVGSNPYWKVYLNTGSGFSTAATNWTLPSGGYKNSSGHNYGFYGTFESGYYYSGCQGWSTMDIDGDGKADLVVTSQGDGSYKNSFSVGSGPYWKVYLNTGSGFSTTVTNWTLPSGGYKNSSGHNYGFYGTYESGYYYSGCQGWSTMDINGDGKADLVVTSQGNGSYKDSFGVGSSPYWRVYLSASTVGVEEVENQTLLAYPNPTDGRFLMDLSGFGSSVVTMYDSRGTIIEQKQIQSGALSDFDLTNYSAGTYYITVSDAGKTYSAKVLKK